MNSPHIADSKYNQLRKDVDVILNQLRTLLLRKQQDYGPLNISLAPGGPLNGLRVRMFDKLQRFSNIVETNNDTPNFESLEDTFIDLANYAIIALLVQRGQWEGLPNAKNSSPIGSTDSVPRSRSPEDRHLLHQELSSDGAMVRGRRVGRAGTKSLEQRYGG